jgi:hypothetical protein
MFLLNDVLYCFASRKTHRNVYLRENLKSSKLYVSGKGGVDGWLVDNVERGSHFWDLQIVFNSLSNISLFNKAQVKCRVELVTASRQDRWAGRSPWQRVSKVCGWSGSLRSLPFIILFSGFFNMFHYASFPCTLLHIPCLWSDGRDKLFISTTRFATYVCRYDTHSRLARLIAFIRMINELS